MSQVIGHSGGQKNPLELLVGQVHIQLPNISHITKHSGGQKKPELDEVTSVLHPKGKHAQIAGSKATHGGGQLTIPQSCSALV